MGRCFFFHSTSWLNKKNPQKYFSIRKNNRDGGKRKEETTEHPPPLTWTFKYNNQWIPQLSKCPDQWLEPFGHSHWSSKILWHDPSILVDLTIIFCSAGTATHWSKISGSLVEKAVLLKWPNFTYGQLKQKKQQTL